MKVARKERNRSTTGKILKMDTRLRQMHTKIHCKRGNKNKSNKRRSRK